MPAGITETDGMAYVGRRPWHGLGTYVEGQAMTSGQAIEAAGLDWEVLTEPVYRNVLFAPGRYTEIEGKRVIVRKDTDEVFGVKTDRYTPFQNLTCFEVMTAVVGSGDAVFHTVGSLFGGRRVWMLCRIPGDYRLDNGEKLESFILLDNSHDGRSALRMRLTPVRVVCSNTLGAATKSAAAFSARHTPGIMGRVSEARTLLGLNAMHMERMIEEANRIADRAWSHGQMMDMVRELLPLDPDKTFEGQHGSMSSGSERMVELYHSGRGNRGESRWDAYNAVTEWLDYEKPGRSIDSVGASDDLAASRRLHHSWFSGYGQAMREKAMHILSR